ncbi:MAG: Smr/MutS family protein [Bacteroidales bacterium]|nr:Smr/MutS family protein [Bacteroidales bacterium]
MAKIQPAILKIDIHGLTAQEAKEKVQEMVKKAPRNVQKIVVVHGYHNGTVLSEMVRRQIRSPRIVDIIPAVGNDGETVIWLKE